MRILFARPARFIPEVYAGSEVTIHWLCRALIANGHEVANAAITATAPGAPVTMDRQCGYPVFRGHTILDAIRVASARFRADVVVSTQAGVWMKMLQPILGNVPLIVYVHDIPVMPKFMPVELDGRAVYLANSTVTSMFLSQECGIASTIVPPLFGIGRYAGIQRSGSSILFVSMQRRKGSDIAVRIAQARPDVSFIFVESWSGEPVYTQKLREFVANMANVTLLPNQPGLGHILPKVKLLLMPSRSKEAWGRTASEAQICGIPVLGSSRGNLPITIGSGGMTLDPDGPIEFWLQAFDTIMGDSTVYEELSRKALEHGRLLMQEVKRAYQTFERALFDVTAISQI